MHEPLTERVEEYLQGRAIPEMDAHLEHCESCREEIEGMRSHTALLRSLRPAEGAEPSAGFYARVLNQIEGQSRQSMWNIFSESIFAKRLAFASMALFVLLGTYLVSSADSERQLYTATAPEVLIANDDHIHPALVDNPQHDREVVLVNLASYQQ